MAPSQRKCIRSDYQLVLLLKYYRLYYNNTTTIVLRLCDIQLLHYRLSAVMGIIGLARGGAIVHDILLRHFAVSFPTV